MRFEQTFLADSYRWGLTNPRIRFKGLLSMVEATKTARSVDPDGRRYLRFNLRCPVRLGFRDQGLLSEVDAVSENVSIGGLLLTSASLVPNGSLVGFVMTVKEPSPTRSIFLKKEGKVVRVEPSTMQTGYSIAVDCKRPLSQLVKLTEKPRS